MLHRIAFHCVAHFSLFRLVTPVPLIELQRRFVREYTGTLAQKRHAGPRRASQC